MAPEDHAALERSLVLAHLNWSWSGAYRFSYEGGRYLARRTDTGATVSDSDLAAFRQKVTRDYIRNPVPRKDRR